MFPIFGRGTRKGQAVPRHAKNFLKWRIRSIAERLEILKRLIRFQVMRRSPGTHLSDHGTFKHTQRAQRRATITTTGNVYVQVGKKTQCVRSTLTLRPCWSRSLSQPAEAIR